MSVFKVGQRVRIIDRRTELYGATGVITSALLPTFFESLVGPKVDAHDVTIDGLGRTARSGLRFAFEPHELAPLTDPGADAFIEQVKRWKPELEQVVKQKERA